MTEQYNNLRDELFSGETPLEEIKDYVNKVKYDRNTKSFRPAFEVAYASEEMIGDHKLNAATTYYIRDVNNTWQKRDYGDALQIGDTVTVPNESKIIAWNFDNGDFFDLLVRIEPPKEMTEKPEELDGKICWVVLSNLNKTEDD